MPGCVLKRLRYGRFYCDIVKRDILGSIVVSISACHAEDPGSIPGRGVLFHFQTFYLRDQTLLSFLHIRYLYCVYSFHESNFSQLAVNTYVYPVGLGAYHTGVEVYGRGKVWVSCMLSVNLHGKLEYAYGCHPYSYSGIYDMEPRQADEITGQQVHFREAILIGHTHFSSEEVKGLVVLLGRDYNGCDYTILHRLEPIFQ